MECHVHDKSFRYKVQEGLHVDQEEIEKMKRSILSIKKNLYCISVLYDRIV